VESGLNVNAIEKLYPSNENSSFSIAHQSISTSHIRYSLPVTACFGRNGIFASPSPCELLLLQLDKSSLLGSELSSSTFLADSTPATGNLSIPWSLIACGTSFGSNNPNCTSTLA
jgi:hypothetical protein